MSAAEREYVSRAGRKLAAALDALQCDPGGLVCADFGAHVGGFVDCLLQHGAARVYAVEPGYGVLDYGLRQDPRVVVCERTNALHWTAPEPVDLVTIDVGWTPQRLILPSARRALRGATSANAPVVRPPVAGVLTLIKPQYEAPQRLLRRGVLPDAHLEQVLADCRRDIVELDWRIVGEVESPIRGSGGNREWVWRLVPG